jgi:hypothetical protein
MPLLIELPDDMAAELGGNPAEQSQRAKEAIALELYREGRISLRTMGRIVGLGDDVWAADAFRANHRLAVSGAEADDIQRFLP